MNLRKSKVIGRHFPILTGDLRRLSAFWLFIFSCIFNLQLAAAEPATNSAAATELKAAPRFNVTGYEVESKWLLPTNVLVPLFSKYTGTNISLEQIAHAASALELEYVHEGYPTMNIVVAPKRIKNGIVTLDAFPGAMAQIVVAGYRYLVSSNGIEVAVNPSEPLLVNPPEPAAKTPSTAGATTNAGPRFTVNKYLIAGNSLLPPQAIGMVVSNVPGAYGTNVSFNEILGVRGQLQAAYRERGYVTVSVGLPPQRLTNATVKVQVIEGRLNSILVKGNHYFSSNNVMRALPGLYEGMILNALTFQAELNRANANQDRQIYPVLEPGPDPGTSDLTLQVKDRLPLHGKIEFNNQSSPGTPDFRLNGSATYNNLWDLEHSVGVQYSCTPWDYKAGNQWNLYDVPLVANYSAYYRMPLGSPEAVDDTIAANPGSFGYNEATRKFNLPPPSGQPELNVYASRSTIDTGIETLSSSVIYDVPGVRSITQGAVQQDLTINNDVGARLSAPVATLNDSRWGVSGGLDFKTYETTSAKTNVFGFSEITLSPTGHPNPPITSEVVSPVPLTYRPIEYLPLALGLNGNWHTPRTTLSWGLGLSANLWYSGSRSNLQGATGSAKSTGHWVTLTPSLAWQIPIHTNWLTTIRLDGQVTTEPLISTEQFGAGGVNSVRGYQEGEVFGDDGWHVTLEQQTPPHTVGMIDGRIPLVIRGSVYMDYAHTYLLDPPRGAPDGVALWGTGVGCVASIGSFWETRFLFSLPLLRTYNTGSYEPFFNFSLTAQF